MLRISDASLAPTPSPKPDPRIAVLKAAPNRARVRFRDVDVSTLRRPSALIPPAMSAAALGVVAGHVALFGTARQADEGAAAHLWQLLLAGQLPVIAFFVLRWLPRTPGPALLVLALQLSAGMAAAAPVFLLRF